MGLGSDIPQNMTWSDGYCGYLRTGYEECGGYDRLVREIWTEGGDARRTDRQVFVCRCWCSSPVHNARAHTNTRNTHTHTKIIIKNSILPLLCWCRCPVPLPAARRGTVRTQLRCAARREQCGQGYLPARTVLCISETCAVGILVLLDICYLGFFPFTVRWVLWQLIVIVFNSRCMKYTFYFDI